MTSQELAKAVQYYKEIIKYYDKQIQTLKELIEYLERDIKERE